MSNKDKRNENNNLQGEIWNDTDDALLAETVLRFVRQGQTVIAACREMEEVTNGRRTTSASKFRWFTKLVDQYQAGYELAKQEGDKVKATKKRKVNKGERFEEIVTSVFNEDIPTMDKEIEPDDFIILAKKFKQQQLSKEGSYKKFEKELKAERKRVADLEKQLKETKADLDETIQLYANKKQDYQNILEALQVLKKAGINIQVPEPSKATYKINKDGTIETI